VALKLLAQTAATEFTSQKIRVANIAPGAIATPIDNFVLDDREATGAVASEIALGHLGPPEQIAAAMAWVASAEADYVSRSTLVVDGGTALLPQVCVTSRP